MSFGISVYSKAKLCEGIMMDDLGSSASNKENFLQLLIDMMLHDDAACDADCVLQFTLKSYHLE